MKRTPLALSLLTLASLAWLPATGLGQGGLFRSAPPLGREGSFPLPGSGTTRSGGGSVASRTVVDAGAGPEVPFSEDRWEFWWEFNHDALLHLRPTLHRQSVAGQEFTPLGSDEKRQVLMPELIRALRDRNELVRAAACHALSRLGEVSAVMYLKHAAMSDASLVVRMHAVLALGQTRSPRAVDTLHSFLWDEHRPDEVRAYAAVALGMLGTPAASALLRDIQATGEEIRLPYTVRLAVVYGLGLTEDRTNAPLLRSMAVHGTEDDRTRALVVLALGRVGDRAANPILVDALSDHETQVRRSAAIALGILGEADDLDVHLALDRAADDDADFMVRNLADLSLGRIARRGPSDLIGRLSQRLREAPTTRRSFVALALGLSGKETAAPALRASMRKESSHSVLGAHAVALALLGDEESVPALRRRYMDTEDPMLRGYLAFALGRLHDQESQEPMREDLATTSSPELLRWTAVGLSLMGDEKVAPQLAELGSKDHSVVERSTAAYLQGLVGDEKALQRLRDMASREGETDRVRAFSYYAMGMLCDEFAEPAPAAYARDHNYTMSLPFISDLYFLF